MSLKKCFILILILTSTSIYADWGFFAHRKINHLAVFTIPDSELFHFYKFHIDFISDHAVDPDKRRYAVKGDHAFLNIVIIARIKPPIAHPVAIGITAAGLPV